MRWGINIEALLWVLGTIWGLLLLVSLIAIPISIDCKNGKKIRTPLMLLLAGAYPGL